MCKEGGGIMSRIFLFDINHNIIELLEGKKVKWDIIDYADDFEYMRGQESKCVGKVYTFDERGMKVTLWESEVTHGNKDYVKKQTLKAVERVMECIQDQNGGGYKVINNG
jgi:hypothetical protein